MKRLLYLCYKIQWYVTHWTDRKYMSPVCYNEWLDNEYYVQKHENNFREVQK